MNFVTIKSAKDFSALYRRGKSYHTDNMSLIVLHNKFTQSAFVVSKKVGNAVCRNLIKRRMRAIFNANVVAMPRASYLWIAKPPIKLTDYNAMHQDMSRLGELAAKVLINKVTDARKT